MINRITLLAFIISLLMIQSCGTVNFRANYRDTNSLLHGTSGKPGRPFLKAHMKNGDVCILRDTWKVNAEDSTVFGNGLRYDYNRKLQEQGNMTIPVNAVALFETNEIPANPEGGRITALSILAGVDVAIGVICLTNPKACFGSCPTFYLDGEDNFHYANAEGFSNAILPSMEYGDIDALGMVPVQQGKFSLTMKNEALESHNIRELKVLGVPVAEGQRVHQSPDNRFYRCGQEIPLTSAIAGEGDIVGLLARPDRQERFSLADPKNLLSREEIILTFNETGSEDELGLVLNFRQTLMTTYLFYSAMGYMGDEVGDLFARLETDSDLRKKFDATTRLMGGIEVHRFNLQSGKWSRVGTCYETGPIAINRQLIALGKSAGGPVQIKLVLNRGLWRLDYAALVPVREEVRPQEFRPVNIKLAGKNRPDLLNDLFSANRHLLSMPGSDFRFDFNLPETETSWDLFLYSKGYYMEWMRQHWIADKNLLKLQQMVNNPARYLRKEAAGFKKYEDSMETQFWNSRIDTRTFTYENR